MPDETTTKQKGGFGTGLVAGGILLGALWYLYNSKKKRDCLCQGSAVTNLPNQISGGDTLIGGGTPGGSFTQPPSCIPNSTRNCTNNGITGTQTCNFSEVWEDCIANEINIPGGILPPGGISGGGIIIGGTECHAGETRGVGQCPDGITIPKEICSRGYWMLNPDHCPECGQDHVTTYSDGTCYSGRIIKDCINGHLVNEHKICDATVTGTINPPGAQVQECIASDVYWEQINCPDGSVIPKKVCQNNHWVDNINVCPRCDHDINLTPGHTDGTDAQGYCISGDIIQRCINGFLQPPEFVCNGRECYPNGDNSFINVTNPTPDCYKGRYIDSCLNGMVQPERFVCDVPRICQENATRVTNSTNCSTGQMNQKCQNNNWVNQNCVPIPVDCNATPHIYLVRPVPNRVDRNMGFDLTVLNGGRDSAYFFDLRPTGSVGSLELYRGIPLDCGVPRTNIKVGQNYPPGDYQLTVGIDEMPMGPLTMADYTNGITRFFTVF